MKLVESTFIAKTRTFIASLVTNRPTASVNGQNRSGAEAGGMKKSTTEQGLKNVTNLLMSLVGRLLNVFISSLGVHGTVH